MYLPFRYCAAVLLSCGLAAAVGCDGPDPDAPDAADETPEPEPLEFARDASEFAGERAALDLQIQKASERAIAQPTSWSVLEKVAGLYMQRARLSGDYSDYEAAEAALAEGFERAPEGSGPLLTRAALNFTLHRIDLVEADLAIVAGRPVLPDPIRSTIEGLRGAVAFERGDYETAKTHFDFALELETTSTNLARLAHWHWRQGSFDTAEDLYRQAGDLFADSALEPRAWTELQIGIMDLERGRYTQAFEHYADGAEIMGGWWLLEEHIAEIAVLLERRQQALGLYTEIIDNTGKGEFMDARASVLLSPSPSGEAPSAAAMNEANALIASAEDVFLRELERFPEASYGHALAHYLDFGPPQRALELALENHALRPGVLAKIDLASAYLAVGDVTNAREIVDGALATTWRSADLFWTASQVYEQAGELEQAASFRAEAEALHPTIAVD